jgi:hypothetical protein
MYLFIFSAINFPFWMGIILEAALIKAMSELSKSLFWAILPNWQGNSTLIRGKYEPQKFHKQYNWINGHSNW